MNRPSQKGIALVITLIMLSVVTFMTVAFLALSRRERASVSVASEQTTAALMSDTALAHAQSLLISRLMSRTNLLAYEFVVSTNYVNPNGFSTGVKNPTNVSYTYANGTLLSANDQLLNLNNLFFSPRPPVFINTNVPRSKPNPGPYEFRYFLDLNRNANFEPTGWLATLVPNPSNPNQVTTNGQFGFFAGDPQWIGVLEKPNQPHAGNNRFIGRYAFIIQPEGKSLDVNYLHNQAKRPTGAFVDGYYRNQGVGSWELNLAAFFRELNTNEWPTTAYQYALQTNIPSAGWAFLDALKVLRYRYNQSYLNLASVNLLAPPMGLLGAGALTEIRYSGVDYYSDGPRMTGIYGITNRDDPRLPWPGSDNPVHFSDVQELFDAAKINDTNFHARLKGTFAGYTNTQASFYDRYTFYRLFSQMGVDSSSVASNKVNLNYKSDISGLGTNFQDWQPIDFFTNAVDKLLRSKYSYLNLSVTNIPIFPTNYYDASVHRLLQLAANIYDATTNQTTLTGGQEPFLPHVFRPVFKNTGTNIAIAGFQEVTNTTVLNARWQQLETRADTNTGRFFTNGMVNGIPLVIGAKRGLPNFNEYEMKTGIQVTRRLNFVKDPRTARIVSTNQLFEIGISNIFAVEAWNSYNRTYPRRIQLLVTNEVNLALWANGFLNRTANLLLANTNNTIIPRWSSNTFEQPLTFNYVFRPDTNFPDGIGFTNIGYLPRLQLAITNNLWYAAVDLDAAGGPRIIDMVTLKDLGALIDITTNLIGNLTISLDTSELGKFWRTNLVVGGVPEGIKHQIEVSLGNENVSEAVWTSYSGGEDRRWSIDKTRVFVGLTPLVYSQAEMQQEVGKSFTVQLPFSVTRKFFLTRSWQANDPLVHYTVQDLDDPLQEANAIEFISPPQTPSTNSNIGKINLRYRPWGYSPKSSDTNIYNMALKDPGVFSSSDWFFPTNKFPSLGWLGRVHRGSPWQTVYLKSHAIDGFRWMLWSGHTNWSACPTNDWHLLELFTTAPSANAARGLLSVNQTNTAAWASVLGGVSALTGTPTWTTNKTTNFTEIIITPGTPEFREIVDDINRTREKMPGQVFRFLGEVMATPALSTNSPYLSAYRNVQAQRYSVTDEVVERIPQQILSLLKEDEPRVVVYAYGQALAPAGAPVLSPGDPWHNMYTNYAIVSETAWKQAFRVVGSPSQPQIVPEGPRVPLSQ